MPSLIEMKKKIQESKKKGAEGRFDITNNVYISSEENCTLDMSTRKVLNIEEKSAEPFKKFKTPQGNLAFQVQGRFLCSVGYLAMRDVKTETITHHSIWIYEHNSDDNISITRFRSKVKTKAEMVCRAKLSIKISANVPKFLSTVADTILENFAEFDEFEKELREAVNLFFKPLNSYLPNEEEIS